MSRRRVGLVSALLCAGLLPVLPATAPATEQCVFQGVKTSSTTAGKVERSLLCLTNLHRFRNSLAMLKRDTRLGAAARAHSADMVARDYFSHSTPEGLDPSDRAHAAGYPGGAGENIAANFTGSAFSLFDQWRNSDGHNQNMLTAGYRTAGFGVSPGGPGRSGGATGTQMFGFAPANTGDDALDLYASSGKCAKAKARLIRFKQLVREGKRIGRERVKKLRKKIRRRCRPLA